MEDSTTSYSTIIISVLMAVVIIATVMIPIITATTQTTTITEIDNEGAGWLKLGYSSGNDFDFEITNENSNISIGDQTGTMGDNIFYADSKNVIFADSGKNAIFLLDTDTSSVHKFSSTVSVENTEGTLNISDGTETVVSSESPTWAYIPDSAGTYGFFTNGGLSLEEGKPTVSVGSYAGVFAYNDTVVAPDNLGSLGLVKSGDYADGVVTWAVPDPNSTDENTRETPLNANYESDSVIGLNAGNNIIFRSADPTTGTRIGDLYYTFSGTTATIVGYSSEINWGSFTSIPDTVEYNGVTYTIKSIGHNAFQSCTQLILTSLPSGITSIGYQAFSGCTNLALTSLPSGLTSIGFQGFKGCTNLALTSLPSGLNNIDYQAFSGCTNLALTSLPSGLTTISQNTFEQCTNLALTSLPSGITSIDKGAFNGCTSLALTSLPSGITVINEYIFEQCTNLALTSLPSGITSIGTNAFFGCTNLALTSLPSGLRTIGNNAFTNCTNLALTSLPSGLTTVGSRVFANCYSMESIIILNSPTFTSTSFSGTSINEVLNLGELEMTPTSYGLRADSVQDYVSALGYVAPVSIHNTIIVEDTSLSATLLKLLPVFMVLVVVIFIGYAMLRPDSDFIKSLKSR